MVDKELLRRYFENSISSDEKMKLDKWILDSANEEVLLNFIEESYYDEKDELAVESFDKVFEEIQRRKSNHSKVISLVKRKWLWTAAAACILFLVVGGLVGYLFNNHKERVSYGDVLLMNSSSTSYGQYAQLVLDDGSEIYLGENSEISLSDRMAIHPTVYLEGEAYFNLKDGGKTLTVRTKDLVTTAKNSKFNITSYKKDSIATVSVEVGKAEISENREVFPLMKLRIPQKDSTQKDTLLKLKQSIPLAKIRPVINVNKNEQVTFDRNTKTTDVKEVSPKVIPLIDLKPARPDVNVTQ